MSDSDFNLNSPVIYQTVGGAAGDSTIDGRLTVTSITGLNGLTTVGPFGVPAIVGLDNRKGLTAVDASTITVYTTTGATQLYRLSARILATAGTSPRASYVVKWIEGGVTIAETLTIAALSTIADLCVLIQPDSGTVITAQLTAIGGTSTAVNVATMVEEAN